MGGVLDDRSGMMPPIIPIATYRLQLTGDFGFDDAVALVPYLRALGISHLYASPFLKARAGSTHGYDVVDHNAFNPELGGADAFARLSDALARADMGLILDFVPNHMGVHFADNPWWLDTLEWGPKSSHAASFDIDWETLPAHPRGGVLVPILGRPYGEALEEGEIELRYDARSGTFSAWYFEHRLPIEPSRYSEIIEKVVGEAAADDTAAGRQLLAVAARYRGPHNPPREQGAQLKSDLAAIPGAAEVIERGLAAYRPAVNAGMAVLPLHYLLERQHYRLAYWRLAGSEINYRRFFDINTLAGLRVEHAETFRGIHGLVRRLIRNGKLHGLRFDHIDGLRDPHQYCRRIHRLIETEKPASAAALYLVIEKILADTERLPKLAGVHGTTGYEWLNVISRLLADGNGLAQLDRTWRSVSGDQRGFHEILIAAKRQVIATILASEFTVLARLLARLAAGHYSTRDYAAERLRTALALFILHFPIYRTYLTGSGPSREDRAIIDGALDRARADWFGSDAGIFDFLREALTLDLTARTGSRHSLRRNRRFAFKVQQFTGPMMAKSLEDTAFYRYHRLLALNEVGGEPSAKAMSIADFHRRMQDRSANWPHGMTATATHDTKRGEDARTRLLALSELSDEWNCHVAQWRVLNEKLFTARRPTAAHEYMVYQALDEPGGDFVQRMQAYAVKALREGKEQSSWLAPDEAYERALTDFIAGALDGGTSGAFIESFGAFARRAALIGALKSLTQLTLKVTMPGVPDFYQGTETWDLSLVDPDNRRPVDFAQRRSILPTLDHPDWTALAENWPDSRIKFALIRQLLALRARHAGLFADGHYQPIAVSGADRERVIAFARADGRDAVIVAAALSFAGVTGGGRHWPDRPDWDAHLSLEPFSDVEPIIHAENNAGASVLAGPLPIAVLRARCKRVARTDHRKRQTVPA
jgi:(1->4)-alpha-D-glucan 1-alpha-D-glucosylmutase